MGLGRMQMIGVLFGATPAAAPPTSPPVVTPDPTESAPTYPDYQPSPGAVVVDTGVPGEGTASGTLTIQPAFVLPMDLRRRVDRFESELGYSTVYNRQVSSRILYVCSWGPLSQSDYDTLMAFFAARIDVANRTTVPFNWTPDGESAGVYRLRFGTLRSSFSERSWRADAELVKAR